MNTTIETHIPGDDEVQAASGGKSWRFSDGKIVTGRAKENTLASRPHIRGRVLRIGIYEGKVEEFDRPYKQLEADIETRDGVIYVKSGLLDGETFELRPSRSSLDFAWGLLQIDGGDIIQITTAQGEPWQDPQGRAREASTYVNVSKLIPTPEGDKVIYKEQRLIKPKANKDAPKVSMVDQWLGFEPQIKAHPLFAERSANHNDGEEKDTHLSLLCKECKEKGWPTPEEAPAEWLAYLQKGFKEEKPRASLQSWSEDDWGSVREALLGQKECPVAPAEKKGFSK